MNDPIRPVDSSWMAAPVRRVTPRQDSGEEEGGFEEELEKNASGKKPKPDNDPAPAPDEARAVSPPAEDDAGSHLDLTG